MRLFLSSLLMLSFLLLSGCSSSGDCVKKNSFMIEYSGGGGFTGLEKGITIQNSGLVRKWTRTAGAERVYDDSLALGAGDLEKLCGLMSVNDTVRYKRSEKGNYTTVLILTSNGVTNEISFAGNDVPADAPPYVGELLAQIRKIHHQ